jgi:hypothetical protein
MPSVTEAGIEVFSALSDPDILEACRVVAIAGSCDICGYAAVGGLHCPECCHGAYCSRHCPVCTGLVSLEEAEREAMRRNRDAQGRFEAHEAHSRASGDDGRGRWPRATRPCGNLPPDARLMVAETSAKIQGRRKRIYDLIESGMSVRAFFERCQQAGLPGARANLGVLMRVYGAVRIT